MKKLLLFLFVLPTLSWSQDYRTGLIFDSIIEAPKVIQLSKYRSVAGNLELRYIQENPRTTVRFGYASAEVKNFIQKVLASDLDKLSCDGDFSLTYDAYGNQYIIIKSIKVCLDKDGWVVAHSFGIPPLNPVQIVESTRLIQQSRIQLKSDPAVSESHISKDDNPNAGVFIDHKSEATAQIK